MLVVLAILALSWDPVTRDCRGGLESAPPVYEVWTYRATVVGSISGPDGDLWPVYQRTTADVLTQTTSLAIADPAVGGVVAWGEPVAVDLAGNRSDGGCP